MVWGMADYVLHNLTAGLLQISIWHVDLQLMMQVKEEPSAIMDQTDCCRHLPWCIYHKVLRRCSRCIDRQIGIHTSAITPPHPIHHLAVPNLLDEQVYECKRRMPQDSVISAFRQNWPTPVLYPAMFLLAKSLALTLTQLLTLTVAGCTSRYAHECHAPTSSSSSTFHVLWGQSQASACRNLPQPACVVHAGECQQGPQEPHLLSAHHHHGQASPRE